MVFGKAKPITWNRVLLGKLAVAQLLKKLPAFMEP
jgi:hypothetical protein